MSDASQARPHFPFPLWEKVTPVLNSDRSRESYSDLAKDSLPGNLIPIIGTQSPKHTAGERV